MRRILFLKLVKIMEVDPLKKVYFSHLKKYL